MNILDGYIGTYYSEKSPGIFQFRFNTITGALTVPALLYEAKNAKCSALWGSLLAAPLEKDGRAGICIWDTSSSSPVQSEIFTESKTACFIVQDSTYIFTANYHEGTVLIYWKAPESLVLHKKIEIAPMAGCHQILFHDHYLLVPCLELDEIRIFDREFDYQPAGKIKFPKGSGPRHGIFNRSHTHLYVVTERSNELFTFDLGCDLCGDSGNGLNGDLCSNSDNGLNGDLADDFCVNSGSDLDFELVSQISVLNPEAGNENASAAIRLSPDEHFLYVSVRGADFITVISLTGTSPLAVQYASCQGSHPRDFVLSPNGRFLLIVNRTSNELVCMCRNSITGFLEEVCSRVPVPEGVGIILDTHTEKEHK